MIHYILFRTQSHATEDVARVREALAHVLPEETPVDALETEGYFGNPITILTARLEKKAAERYLGFLRQKMPEPDLKAMISELPERVDEGCFFYLRLSKQDAYLGDVRTYLCRGRYQPPREAGGIPREAGNLHQTISRNTSMKDEVPFLRLKHPPLPGGLELAVTHAAGSP